ncbi:MAG: EAL domain-containing protein, partial [Campylobacterota bacterium]|nr:EAL domain-containing protein [Campylobacterota bacterium]
MQNNNFSKRLTVLILKENTHCYDDFFLDTFGSVIFSYMLDEAHTKFFKNHIDMIIVELGSLNDEKFSFLRDLKKDRKFLLTMVLSIDTSFNLLKRTMENGIDEYVLNPIDQVSFIKVVKNLESKYLLGEEYETNLENLNLLKQYQTITDSSSIVSKTDSSGRITYANDNFCKISGYTKNDLIGQNHNIIRSPDTPKAIFKDFWNTIKDKKEQWNGIIKNISKSGKSYYVKSSVTPILNKDNEIVEYIALRQNISSILSDKKHFLDKIEANHLSILILVQIDEFEMLEKFYNLTTIDQIEKMFGYKVLTYLPDSYKFDNVYNLDNGRYALLTDFDHFDKKNIKLDEYLKEFVSNVKKSILEIDDIEYDINISLSYAMGKHMLYEDAKAGLSEAMESHVIICHSNDFSIRHQKEAKKNLDVIKMVKIALDNYNIISYFQPIINNNTKEVVKYESLVRLIDEYGKILSPYEFLNISKKGYYYNKITKRVLDNSFKMLNNVTTKLSINLSTLDIEKEETREHIYLLLDEYKDDNNRLVFELLEDENVKDFQVIKDFIRNIKKRGVCIAIDDFGVGYSNFERLLEFEPDILKIDGSLIRNITTDKY